MVCAQLREGVLDRDARLADRLKTVAKILGQAAADEDSDRWRRRCR
jgi:hypothetical protein